METTLFRQFLRHPTRVGAVCPSSQRLCRDMVGGSGVRAANVVVELGPGTGAITAEIIKNLHESSRFVAIELDEKLCRGLREKFSNAIFCNGSASEIEHVLEREFGCGTKAEAVISALPWSVFSEELQCEIISAVRRSMAPGGCFATFAYLQGMMLPAGVRFRRLLKSKFEQVHCGRVIWNNLPPAVIYFCR